MQRLLQHGVIIAYLLLLTLAAGYAALRYQPVPLRPLTLFLYGMLAPYQGYSETSEAFLAEGQIADGTWEKIDLAPYLPGTDGERNMRERRIYTNEARAASTDVLYREVALRIQALEAKRGNHYSHVRLTWVQWGPTPMGFWDTFDMPIQSRLLITAP